MEIINYKSMKKALKDYDELLFITTTNHKLLKKSLKDDDELLFVCISVHFCTKTCNKVYKNMHASIQKEQKSVYRTVQKSFGLHYEFFLLREKR